MITRKDWNNLTPHTRKVAASLVFFNMGEDFQKQIGEEWHHDNDRWHQVLFQSIYWNKGRKGIKVVVNLEP